MTSQSINPSTPNEGRVFFRDVKPYAIVDDLDQLRGPGRGQVGGPRSVWWCRTTCRSLAGAEPRGARPGTCGPAAGWS